MIALWQREVLAKFSHIASNVELPYWRNFAIEKRQRKCKDLYDKLHPKKR